MSWIQDNKVPAAILGITGAGVVGLGYLLFDAWSTASASKEAFDTTNNSLVGMKSATLAPTPENVAKKTELVGQYIAEARRLDGVLRALEESVKPKPISPTDFQAKVKARVAEIRKAGGNRLPAEFNLAFEKYIGELPKNDQEAMELSGYLDAVEAVTRLLLDSGVDSIVRLDRSPLASEGGAKPSTSRSSAPAAKKITERRTVTVVISADQGPLQLVLTKLASPSDMDHFSVVRQLRIENVVKEGPARVASIAPENAGDFTGSTPPAPAAPEAAAVTSVDGAPAAAPAAAKSGVQPANKDSDVVFGKEKLMAYLEIDLVTFVNTNTAAAAPQR